MKQKLNIILGLILIFTILGACSKTDEASNANSDGLTEINLGIWGTSKEIEREQQLIDSFNEEYPDIKVNLIYKSWDSYWNWLTSQASAGDMPDVFKIDPAYVKQYAKLGAMKELDELIESSDFDTSNFAPNVLDIHQVDGKQVSLPRDANAIVMVYNKDMFDEANLDYPEGEMTWEQILEMAQKLTIDNNGNDSLSPSFDAKNINQYGLSVGPSGTADSVLEPQLWSNGARLLDENNELALDSPKALEVLNFFKDLTVKHQVNFPASELKKLGNDEFLVLGSKRVAMSFTGSWNIQTLKDAGINFDIFLPPTFGDGEQYTVVQPAGYAMSPTSKKEEAAWKLMSWLSGPEGQNVIAEQGQSLPANKEAFDAYLPDEDGFNKEIMFEAQTKSIPDPYMEDVTKLWWEFIPQKLERPLFGKGDIDQAVKEIKDLWDSSK